MLRNAIYRSLAVAFGPQLRRLESASREPRRAQLERLSAILEANQGSRFGQEHGFESMNSWSDFSRAVPVRNYEDFSEYIEAALGGEKHVLTGEQPFMFATTSGTTGKPKYVPVTRSYMDEYRRASAVSILNMYRDYPLMAKGNTLTVVSSASEGVTPCGIPFGAISGAIYGNVPSLVRKYFAPIPYEVFTISDYETRYYTLLRLALTMPISFLITPNPSTIDILCRRLGSNAESLIDDVAGGTLNPPGKIETSLFQSVSRFCVPDGKRAKELKLLLDSERFMPSNIWPELALISCWTGAAASFYLEDFPHYFGSTKVEDMTYCASEGRGSVYLGPGKQMLAIDSHYYEFIPEAEIESADPPILLADQLEEGENYYILFTTSGGLYRYNINDVIKVTGFYNRTPLIEFQYKGGNVSSFTGEKITELQVTEAMRATRSRHSLAVRFFTLVPCFRPRPHYEVWLEADPGDLDHDGLARTFDHYLMKANIEYESKRHSGRLMEIEVRNLPLGTYEEIRAQLNRSGVSDAQIKLSHLNPKESIRSLLEDRLSCEQV